MLKLLFNAPCLAHFDLSREITVSADACYNLLGIALFQLNHENVRELVAYVSRPLTPTEVGYAQIEREAIILYGQVRNLASILLEFQ